MNGGTWLLLWFESLAEIMEFCVVRCWEKSGHCCNYFPFVVSHSVCALVYFERTRGGDDFF